jgi:hypothetical protein
MKYDIINGRLVKGISFFTFPPVVVYVSALLLAFGFFSFIHVLTAGFYVWPGSYVALAISGVPLLLRTSLFIESFGWEAYQTSQFAGITFKVTKLKCHDKAMNAELFRDEKSANWKVLLNLPDSDVKVSFFETIDKKRANAIVSLINSNLCF